MGWPRVTRWVLGAGGTLLAAALLAHAPPVRATVLAWALSQLRSSLGVQAQAERLDYNLLTLRFALHRVILRSEDAQLPFFESEDVRLNLPWSIVGGPLGVESLEIDRPRIQIVRQADGSLNVPGQAAADRPTAPIGAIAIGHLAINDLVATYEDAPLSLSMEGRGVTLLMQPTAGALAGRVSVSGGVTVRSGDRTTSASTLEGGVGFDSETISLSALTLTTPEGELTLDGRVGLLTPEQRVDLRFVGRLDAERLAPWVGVPPGLHGRFRVTGTAGGSLADPQLRLEGRSEGLTWSAISDLSIEFGAEVTGDGVIVDALQLGIAGGLLSATADIPFDQRGTSRLRVRWRDVDVGALASAATLSSVRIAVVADGESDVQWTGLDIETAQGTVAARLRAAATPARAWPLSGHLSLALDRGRFAFSAEPVLARSVRARIQARGRLDAADLAASALNGRVELDVPSLGAAVHGLDAAGLALPSVATDMSGTAVATLAVGGTLGSPRLAGDVEIAALKFAGVGPGQARARVDATTTIVRIDALRIEAADSALTGDLTLQLATGGLAGVLAASIPSIVAVTGAVPALWRPTGAAQVAIRLGGTIDNPMASAELSARDLRLASQTIDTLDATARLVDRVVTLDRIEMTQNQRRLTATARYDISSDRYVFDAAGDGIEIGPIEFSQPEIGQPPNQAPASAPAAWPLNAIADLRLSGEGTLSAPRARGTIRFARLAWGPYDLRSVQADIRVEDGLASLAARDEALHATIDATIAMDAPRRFTATASFTQTELADVLPPDTVGGTTTLQASASGDVDDLARATVDITVDQLTLAVNAGRLQLDRPARMRYAEGVIGVQDVSLRTGATAVSVSGVLGVEPARAESADGLVISVAGRLADLVALAPPTTGIERLDAAGDIDVRVQATGSLQSPRLDGTASLARASLAWGSWPAATGVAVQAVLAQGQLDVRELRGTWQEASVAASGLFPLTLLGDLLPETYRRSLPLLPDRARGTLQVSAITPAALAPFLDAATIDQLGGRIDLSATAEAAGPTLADLTADITLTEADLLVARVPLRQTAPTRLRQSGGRLDVVSWTWAGAGNEFTVTGGVDVERTTPELDLGLTGTVDLRMLSALTRDVATGGRATLDVTIAGPATAPTARGPVTVRDGEIVVREPRFAITALNGRAVFSGERVDLADVTADANGGTVTIAGALGHRNLVLDTGELSVTGRGMALEMPPHLRTEVDADLRLAVAGAVPSLTGRVTILRGSYREPISLARQLLAGMQAPLVDRAASDSGAADRIGLDVAVVSAELVAIDNNYGRIEVASNLRVIGTLGEPIVTGRLSVQEGGRVFLSGQTYQVQRGTVDFTNQTRTEPTVALTLDTRVQNYDITLDVSGTPAAIEARLTSPGLSQQDIVSLLLTGQKGDPSAALQAEVAQDQLLTLLSGELLGFAGRAAGLDSVQLSRGLGGATSDFDLFTTDVDPRARLTVTKDLSQHAQVVVSQSLRESGSITWMALYRLTKDVEARATTDDDGGRSYALRHELRFGGPPPMTSSARARPPGARIGSVRLLGTPPGDEGPLRDRIRLRSGDRFAFDRWQQDRDRLLAFYREREFLEVSIAARRTTGGPSPAEPTIDLDYEVTTGPRTRLIVDGYDAPPALLARMRDMWALAVFDGFLLDDLAALARSFLAETGHLQAVAEARVTSVPESPVKTIRVRIVPGTRYQAWRVTWTGNRQVSSEELDTLVSGLDVTAWLDPGAVAAAITERYRAIGMLGATVTPAAPIFTDSLAALPMRVDEGPAFQVTGVEVHGVAADLAEQVRETFDIEPGAPYVAAAIEQARRAVEARYRSRGYRDARVSVSAMVESGSGRAGLRLTVDEGRQQVLSDVRVQGDDVTARSMVDRTLSLTPGQPVSQGQVSLAQKRLYDTGLFETADISLASIEPAKADGGAGPQLVRADVTLRELPPYRFRYGIRLSDDVGPAGATRETRPALVVDLFRRNLFGQAMSAGAAGQIETNRRLARGIFTLPTFAGLPVTTSLFLTTSRQDFTPEGATPFVEDKSDLTAEQRFRPSGRTAVSYGYSLSRNHVFEPDPALGQPALDLNVRVARLTGAYGWDTRDDPSNTRRGWFHSSGLEFGSQALGSDLRFIRFLAQQYHFAPIGRRLVLASAVRVGAGRGFGQDLIPSEKFFAGGGTSVRGFAEDGLGDRDFFGDATGGNALVVLNEEARFPLFRWIHGVGFVDVGNVFGRARDVSLSGLDAGLGAGLRIQSPFALLRIDFGVPLTSRARERAVRPISEARAPLGRWYFGIGHTF